MSPPPRPHPTRSTGREQSGDLQRLDYLPLQYADLLELQEELAGQRLGRPRRLPGADGDAEADVARTFMELSALVGHVLSVYQRHRAGEAFLSTAQAPSSLVRHAHRLAYQPDPGLAASGHVVLVAKEGVTGTVAAGLALASVPLGDTAAQDYESRDDVVVDAALNELVPVGATRPVVVAAAAQELRVQGVGLGVRAGDLVALVGAHRRGFVVTDVREDTAAEVTTVALDRKIGAEIDVAAATEKPVLLARPTRVLRPFGSGADPALFPPASVTAATGSEPATFPKFFYTVQRADGAGHRDADVYLSEQVTTPLTGSTVLRSTGAVLKVLSVTTECGAAVTLNRSVEEPFTTQKVTLTPTDDGGFTTTLTAVTGKLVVSSHVSGNVTAITVTGEDGNPVLRADHPLPAEWLAGWAVAAPLAAVEPDPAPLIPPAEPGTPPVDRPLLLPGVLRALTPGRPLAFRNRAGTAAQIVAIRRAESDESAGFTRVWWDPISAPPAVPWQLDDLVVLGNVVRVSHGRTVRETLGGSDGVTAFQRFTLRESPVTVLPGVAGGEPEITVWVDDVRWERVTDLAESGPDDRHYRCLADENLVMSVVFGDGRTGAVPPSGRANITARYRVGLGRAGDIEPPRLSRLKRAHPLLDRAGNVTPVSGGAQAAGPEAIRTQSTRWIRTFDRAVSVSDLADLALTMPGIARAAARWDQSRGAVLVVATATGEGPPALDAVRAFLDARRDTQVPLELCRPDPRELAVTVDVEPDPAFLVEIVKDAVRQALHGEQEQAPGLFTFPARGLGQPAYLSEVYERLEAVPGVVGVTITRFGSKDGERPAVAADVVPAGVDEWLRLRPQNLTLTVGGRS